MIHVHPVPAFSDNYLWVIHDGRHAAAVDPGDARPVIDYLAHEGLQLTAILCTHHHADHMGGIAGLLDFLDLHGKIPVYGPARENIPGRTVALRGGDRVALEALGLTLEVIDVPGHTAGHIAYYGSGLLFCGDTLFACGCGRLFEGTAAQMKRSLSTLRDLPADTRVYCAHEYTMSNIRFAEAVEPDNAALRERKSECTALRAQGQPTLPTTIGTEIATNPFMRWDQQEVIATAARLAGQRLADDVAVFTAIREWKNNF